MGDSPRSDPVDPSPSWPLEVGRSWTRPKSWLWQSPIRVSIRSKGHPPWLHAVDLLAMPTTAGSGSERTPYAVYYMGAQKHSVAHASLTPNHAIVDPTLTYSMGRELTATSGLDVICHAVESAWAVSASDESRQSSYVSLGEVWDAIGLAVHAPDRGARRAMARASTDAGAAIATAKTTASHALSYYLSAVHAVPHGLAAALTLGPMLVFNSGIDEANVTPGADQATVKEAIERICDILGANDPSEAQALIQAKVSDLGFPNRLSNVGVSNHQEIEAMVDSVNQQRLANNPRRFDRDELRTFLEELLESSSRPAGVVDARGTRLARPAHAPGGVLCRGRLHLRSV